MMRLYQLVGLHLSLVSNTALALRQDQDSDPTNHKWEASALSESLLNFDVKESQEVQALLRIERTTGNGVRSTLGLDHMRNARLEIWQFVTSGALQYAENSMHLWKEYAKIHGYDYNVQTTADTCTKEDLGGDRTDMKDNMETMWNKVCLLRNLVSKPHPETDNSYVLLIDADTLVVDPDFDLFDVILADGFAHGEAGLMLDDRGTNPDYPHCSGRGPSPFDDGVCRPQTAFMVFKRGPLAKVFMEQWLLDARSACRDEGTKQWGDQVVLWECTIPAVNAQYNNKKLLNVINGHMKVMSNTPGLEVHPILHFPLGKKTQMPDYFTKAEKKFDEKLADLGK